MRLSPIKYLRFIIKNLKNFFILFYIQIRNYSILSVLWLTFHLLNKRTWTATTLKTKKHILLWKVFFKKFTSCWTQVTIKTFIKCRAEAAGVGYSWFTAVHTLTLYSTYALNCKKILFSSLEYSYLPSWTIIGYVFNETVLQ